MRPLQAQVSSLQACRPKLKSSNASSHAAVEPEGGHAKLTHDTSPGLRTMVPKQDLGRVPSKPRILAPNRIK
jgi:hypothetical protein